MTQTRVSELDSVRRAAHSPTSMSASCLGHDLPFPNKLIPRRYQEEVFVRAQKGYLLLLCPRSTSTLYRSSYSRKHGRCPRHGLWKDTYKHSAHQVDLRFRIIARQGHYLSGSQSCIGRTARRLSRRKHAATSSEASWCS